MQLSTYLYSGAVSHQIPTSCYLRQIYVCIKRKNSLCVLVAVVEGEIRLEENHICLCGFDAQNNGHMI